MWAILHDDSALALPDDSDQRPGGGSLATLPYPFAGSGGLRDTTIVVDATRAASLRASLDAATELGRASSGPAEFDALPQAEATAKRLGKRHLVLAGIDAGSPLAGAVERALPVVLHPDGTRELVKGDARLGGVLSATRIGVAQVSPVP